MGVVEVGANSACAGSCCYALQKAAALFTYHTLRNLTKCVANAWQHATLGCKGRPAATALPPHAGVAAVMSATCTVSQITRIYANSKH
jgi:hypothetical protein